MLAPCRICVVVTVEFGVVVINNASLRARARGVGPA
jgi:hypothetical protein